VVVDIPFKESFNANTREVVKGLTFFRGGGIYSPPLKK
jgi:hypothetical protein